MEGRGRAVPGLALALAGALSVSLSACGEARGTLVTTTPQPGFRPTPATSFQVQLTGTPDTTVDAALYELDLVDTPATVVDGLHAAGRSVICYLSAGTVEAWRPDAASFPPAAIGNVLAGYPDEHWLDTRDPLVRARMTARLDLARQKGCDGVDLSNVASEADTGFPLAHADVVAYARLLATEAHARGLGAGLGGGRTIAADAAGLFDWALTEGCVSGGSCADFAPFSGASKAVLVVEFGAAGDADTICPAAQAAGVNAIIKNRSYDAFRVPCP